MSRSITDAIENFRPQRTGYIFPSSRHRSILKPVYDYTTNSASINITEDLPHVPDLEWSIYEKCDYIGKMDDLCTHSVYTDEINKVVSNPRDSRYYDNSNPFAVCGNNEHTFDE